MAKETAKLVSLASMALSRQQTLHPAVLHPAVPAPVERAADKEHRQASACARQLRMPCRAAAVEVSASSKHTRRQALCQR
jgi:hypothetical protein